LALAPLTLINVAFLWPKLLAAYFLFLSAADILRGRSAWRAGIWASLAYLSHPVGGLFFPALVLLRVRVHATDGGAGLPTLRRWGGALHSGIRMAAASLLFASPWLAYKAILGLPDVFLRYPLGDGRGFLEAHSLTSWLATRWGNLWYSFVPGAFFFSGQMPAWIEGPLSPVLRWAIQYAKSMPANMGFSWAWAAYAVALGLSGGGAWRRRASRDFALGFMLPGTAVMLVFWGFSSDGLGRNCLEPLSAAAIVWVAASWPLSLRLTLWLALPLWAETAYVITVGFAGATGFALPAVGTADCILFALALAALAAPIAVLLHGLRARGKNTP
jgi:hypothetical protein